MPGIVAGVRRLGMLIVGVLVAVGCTSTVGTPAPVDAASAGAPVPISDQGVARRGLLPAVLVNDLHTGGKVRLSDLIPAKTPLLIWIWAPHCPNCQAEAASVDRFSRRHRDVVTVVGVGTQDGRAAAEDFVRRNGTGFSMLWDDGYDSWKAMRMNGQPAAILVDRAGHEIKRWYSAFPEDDVVRLATQAAAA